MAFIPTPDVAQVELRATFNGQLVENTLYFQHDGAITIAAMDTLALYVADWWDTSCKPLQSQAYVHTEVYVTDLTTATSPTTANTDYAGTAGAITASGPMPGNVTYCVSFRTNGRGRSARGRNYWAGITEAQVTGNEMSAGIRGDILAAYQQHLAPTATDWTWVIVSRQFEGAPRVTGLAQVVTDVVLVDAYIDSQRRRLTGRGV